MTRHRTPPLSRQALEYAPDGPPVRLRDLVAITGLARNTLFSDIERGLLVAWKRSVGNGSMFLIDRREALSYLHRMREPAA